MPTESISLPESARLVELEEIIEKGVSTFIKVGEALAEIRDKKLYRVSHGTFEEYCKEEWQISRRSAYDLISTSSAAQNVQEVAQITREQARPLAKLKEPAQQRAAIAVAVESANGTQPTTAQVESAVEQVQAETQPERSRPFCPSNGMQYARLAIENLKKIQPNDNERNAAFMAVQRFLAQNYQPK